MGKVKFIHLKKNNFTKLKSINLNKIQCYKIKKKIKI